MSIRKAEPADINKLEQLNNEFFHEEGRNWEKLVNSGSMYVLEEKSEVIAFTGLKVDEWNKTGKIIDIFVHPEHRKKGLGTKLVNHLIEEGKNSDVRCIIAEAPSANSVLILYLKCGFRVCGFNDRLYSNDGKETAIFLSYDFN